MRHEKKLFIAQAAADIINRYLTVEPKDESECLGEDDTIVHSVSFGNGIEMDIKCCGVQFNEGESNLAWTEAVLFKDGSQACCTDPCVEYLGEWSCEYDGDEYVVIVTAVSKIVVSNIQWDAPKSAKLPKTITIDIDRDNEDLLEDVIDEYAENLSDYLSDTFGYCHFGFSVDYK